MDHSFNMTASPNAQEHEGTTAMPPTSSSPPLRSGHHYYNDENDDDNMNIPSPSTPATSFREELLHSTDQIFQTRLTWLLVLGPIAVLGKSTGMLGEAVCFCFSGIALIPCAERLSFVTEQVAEHTNGTIGALLNATFGNAPELLISVAALRAGFYRVVQLAMLGSMFTNLILVFGVACIIGGCRWQVQHLRITSGNVSVVMLLVATAGSLFPAALQLSGQLADISSPSTPQEQDMDDVPSPDLITFCRVNAAVMLILYCSYLVFQLGTHMEEFDDDGQLSQPGTLTRYNIFCFKYYQKARSMISNTTTTNTTMTTGSSSVMTEIRQNTTTTTTSANATGSPSKDSRPLLSLLGIQRKARLSYRRLIDADDQDYDDDYNGDGVEGRHHQQLDVEENKINHVVMMMQNSFQDNSEDETRGRRRKLSSQGSSSSHNNNGPLHIEMISPAPSRLRHKSKNSDAPSNHEDDNGMGHYHDDNDHDNDEYDEYLENGVEHYEINNMDHHSSSGPQISMRAGIFWLFIITLCISAMSDILVDTIDGFASKMRISEVFTSMIIIPFFSNVAEQVSAFLFAYRNEMDLVIGVTVGSAIQIATFVLPGSVLIGMCMDRSMHVYFHAYETVSLFFGVLVVGAILQGGTTNWMVGVMLVGIYIMFAAGIWFHELEDLSIDAETVQPHENNNNLTRI